MHSRTTLSINLPKWFCSLLTVLEPENESRQKLDKNEADRHKRRDQVATTGRRRTAPGQFEGKRAVISRVTSALLRAVLVGLLVALPSLLLPGTEADTAQIVIVLAILAFFLTFVDYYGRYPSIIEFRFAPPYNRLRFTALALTVLGLSLITRGQAEPTALTEALADYGNVLGRAIDFPYSPVRLVVLMMPPDADPEMVAALRTAAGVSYAVSLTMLAVFIVMVRLFGWPVRNGAFNVWVNLPLFDPTRGGDVLKRLKRDAGLNVVLGILLPFFFPALVRVGGAMFDPLALSNPQAMIWTMTIWAFLPASILMRGIAISRIADLIEEKRRRAYARAETELLQRA